MRRAVDEVAIGVRRTTTHADDSLIPIKKEIGNSDALVEQAARIGAQIENQ